MMRLLPTLLVLISTLLLQPQDACSRPVQGPAGVAGALEDSAGRISRDLVIHQRGGKSLNEAIADVKRRFPNGRVVSAETQRSGNREVHRIKVLTGDGRVRTISVPGRALGSRG